MMGDSEVGNGVEDNIGNRIHPEAKESENPEGFETVFEYIGGGHLFQWLLFAIVSIQCFLLVNPHIGFVFLGAVPDHWCRVDELQSSLWTAEQIKNISIPRDGAAIKQNGGKNGIVWEQCTFYDLDYASLLNYTSFEEAYSSVDFTDLTTRHCEAWNYDQSIFESTVVTHFNLVCNRRHLVASIQAIYMGGVFVGALLLGPISDKLLGRRKTILSAVLLVLVSGYGAAFAPSFIWFSVFRFFLAVGDVGCYQSCFVLMLEHGDKSFRSLIGILQQMPFAIGYMTMPVTTVFLFTIFAYFFRRWDQLQFSFATSTVVLVSYFWILPESPRWLASRGRDDEAIQRLQKIAEWNKRELPEKAHLLRILATCREEKIKREASLWREFQKRVCASGGNYLDLVRTPELRRKSFAIWTLFMCVAMIYFGVVFDSASLTSDPFLMVFLAGLTEVPAYSLTEPFVAKWGRRPTLILLFILTAMMFFSFVGTPADYLTLQIVFSMSGKLFVTAAFAVVYLVAPELYPTSIRTTGLGSAVIMGRIGSIFAPYTLAILKPVHPALPTGIFGAVALVGALAAWFLPETRNVEMADIVTDADEQGRRVIGGKKKNCKDVIVLNPTPNAAVNVEKPNNHNSVL